MSPVVKNGKICRLCTAEIYKFYKRRVVRAFDRQNYSHGEGFPAFRIFFLWSEKLDFRGQFFKFCQIFMSKPSISRNLSISIHEKAK